MHWHHFKCEIGRSFLNGTPLALNGTRITIPREPIELRKVIEKIGDYRSMVAAIDGVDRTEVDANGFYFDQTASILDWYQPLENILMVSWDSFGPCSSWLDLAILTTSKQRSYLCIHHEAFNEPWKAIAEFRTFERPSVLSTILPALWHGNGSQFNVELLGSLPDLIEDHSRGDIPIASILEACYRWQEWASTTGDPVWVPLRNSLIDKWMEPNPRRRASTTFESALALGASDDGIEKLMRHYRDEEDEMTSEDKLLVLENYLHHAYRRMTAVS